MKKSSHTEQPAAYAEDDRAGAQTLPGVRQMSDGSAAKEVGAERFIVIVIEHVRYVGADGDVLCDLIAAVQIDDAIRRNPSPIYSRQPLERVHPPVPQGADGPTPLVRRPGAELMGWRVGRQRTVGYVGDVETESGIRTFDPPARWQYVGRSEFYPGCRRRAEIANGQQCNDRAA
jgi:hypothetical protein